MGKRNVRIPRQELASRLHEIADLEVHVILTDGTTRFGHIIKTQASEITLRDINARWTSIKKHTHKIPLNTVVEVIFDIVAEY